MFNKKLFILSIILIFLFGIINLKAFSYGEDNLGNSYYESNENLKVPSIEINNLITLKPWVEPVNPTLGMIYLDVETNRLKFYDGEKWYFISLSEKSKEVAKEEIISPSVDTSETISEEESTAISEAEITESTNESSSSTEVSSSEENVSESAEITEPSQAPETSPEIPSEEKTKDEKESKEEKSPKEECSEECNPVCEDVESCSQDCSTDEEGNEVCEEVCAPEELFDITFNLDKSIITNSSLLSGVVTFESFGLIPTLVNVTFIIFNEDGKEIYIEKSSLVVSTEELLRWNYDSLQDLEYGKYVAIVQTSYGDNVFDEFRQDFEIKPSFLDKFNSWLKNFLKFWRF